MADIGGVPRNEHGFPNGTMLWPTQLRRIAAVCDALNDFSVHDPQTGRLAPRPPGSPDGWWTSLAVFDDESEMLGWVAQIDAECWVFVPYELADVARRVL